MYTKDIVEIYTKDIVEIAHPKKGCIRKKCEFESIW